MAPDCFAGGSFEPFLFAFEDCALEGSVIN